MKLMTLIDAHAKAVERFERLEAQWRAATSDESRWKLMRCADRKDRQVHTFRAALARRVAQQDARIAELEARVKELETEVAESLEDIVQQDCYHSTTPYGVRLYGDMAISSYEYAIRQLVELGRMKPYDERGYLHMFIAAAQAEAAKE